MRLGRLGLLMYSNVIHCITRENISCETLSDNNNFWFPSNISICFKMLQYFDRIIIYILQKCNKMFCLNIIWWIMFVSFKIIPNSLSSQIGFQCSSRLVFDVYVYTLQCNFISYHKIIDYSMNIKECAVMHKIQLYVRLYVCVYLSADIPCSFI